jgi:pimeloyl-ACP methyl ester carboxylesterase
VRGRGFLAAAAVLLFAGAAQARAVAADLATPLGTERAAFLAAPGARATVVLLAGGEGIVPINRLGDSGSGNFLIRTRAMWAPYGINAVILGSPNNRSLMGQRSGAGYAAALGAAVDFARSRSNAPVWLVGTSMGSIAAANGAAHLGPKVAGVVLTSAVTRVGRRAGEAVSSAGPAAIAVPALVVANSGDSCQFSPPADAPGLLASMPASPRKELILVDSTALQSDPCEALSPHGYLGIEGSVIQRIATWINAAPGR